MKSAKTSIVAGIVLMTVGGLLLLDLLGIFKVAAFLPPLIFAAVGLVFASLFVRSRENWWAAIPGSVFLGLAAVITATQLSPATAAGHTCSCSWRPDSPRSTCASAATGGP